MNQNKNKPSLKINFLLNTMLQLLNILSPFLTAPYVSRVLGVEQNGIFSYTYSINFYFVMLAGLGTASYGVIESAKVRDDIEERSCTFWGIELITVLTSTVCTAVWLLFSLCYQEHTVILLAMTMYIFAVVFDISWFFLGMEQVQYTVLINAFFKILSIVLIFTLVKSPQHIIRYVCILSGTLLAGNASMWLFLPKFVKLVKVPGDHLWKHIKGTILYFIPTVASSVYLVLDKTLIGIITHDSAQNAYYEQATKIVNLVKAVTFTSLNTLLGSRMAYLFAHEQKQEIAQNRDFALEYVLALGIGATFGIVGVSDTFVPFFFGADYAPASKFLILMSPLIPIMGISNLIGNLYYNPSGRRKKSTILLLVGCGFNLVLNAFFIPAFYGEGAIIASVIAETMITALYVRYSQQFVTFRMLLKSAWKKILAGVGMFVLILMIRNIFQSDLLTLAVQCASGVTIYIILLIVLNDTIWQMIYNKLAHKH